MDTHPTPATEITNAILELWEVFAQLTAVRGYDLDQVSRDWTIRQEAGLRSPGAREDFKELLACGCVPQILAVLMFLLKSSPQLEELWALVSGGRGERRRVHRQLTKAAAALENIFRDVILLEGQDAAVSLAKMGHLPPSKLVSELRMYASLLEFASQLPHMTETRTLTDFMKFALTDYVKAVTGRFRDRNVSALIEEISGQIDYNEVTHRMWRNRNYTRMRKHFSFVSGFLQESGEVFTQRT